jgi:hypothetical protein
MLGADLPAALYRQGPGNKVRCLVAAGIGWLARRLKIRVPLHPGRDWNHHLSHKIPCKIRFSKSLRTKIRETKDLGERRTGLCRPSRPRPSLRMRWGVDKVGCHSGLWKFFRRSCGVPQSHRFAKDAKGWATRYLTAIRVDVYMYHEEIQEWHLHAEEGDGTNPATFGGS